MGDKEEVRRGSRGEYARNLLYIFTKVSKRNLKLKIVKLQKYEKCDYQKFFKIINNEKRKYFGKKCTFNNTDFQYSKIHKLVCKPENCKIFIILSEFHLSNIKIVISLEICNKYFQYFYKSMRYSYTEFCYYLPFINSIDPPSFLYPINFKFSYLQHLNLHIYIIYLYLFYMYIYIYLFIH